MRDDGSGSKKDGRRRGPAPRPGPPPRTRSLPSNPLSGPVRTQTRPSQPRAEVVPPPRTQSSPTLPMAPLTPPPRTQEGPSGTFLARHLGAVSGPREAMKEILQSGFEVEDEVTCFDALRGPRPKTANPFDDDEERTGVGHTFDGLTPAQGVTTRDLFRAIHPPLQSREGRRSGALYEQLLNQFAVGTNPRYDDEAPGRPRGHIFVWDVTRAMGAEIPHFRGGKALSLGLTVDWLRHEGPVNGWRHADEDQALLRAKEGLPVVALPREVKVKLLGMVRPGNAGQDGFPLVACSAVLRGNALLLTRAFGVFQFEFFFHP